MSSSDVAIFRVLEEVRSTDWQSWAIPLPNRLFDYRPESVVPAFERLVRVSSPELGWAVYNELLYAIGHNHSGTPYVAMAPASHFLAQLIPHLGAGAAAAMQVVADCVGWSLGEPPFIGPDGLEHDLEQETRAAAHAVAPLAQQWAGGQDVERRHAAEGLLELLEELDG